jgi:UDP-glucuronate 4-epimerase
MKKVIISGCAGFIGSHLADTLLAEGYQVWGFDNFDPFYDRTIKEQNIAAALQQPHFKFTDLDLLDSAALQNYFEKVQADVVVHLAAKAGVRPSIQNPMAYLQCNVVGTSNLLDACVRHGPQSIVMASSSSVYGNNQKVPFSESDFVDHPISPYAATKKSCELLCHTYSHLYGLNIGVLRFFTVYGPRQRPDLAIAKFAHLMKAGKAIPFYGDGSTERDYTYITDIIQGIHCSMQWLRQQKAGTYQVFNLGESQTVSLERLVRELEQVLACPAKLERLPLQPGDVERTFADIHHAQEILGYRPKVDIVTGLKRYAEWLNSPNSTTGELP